MSEVYHLTKKGEPGLCKASYGRCPLGGDHFDSEQEAYQALANENKWSPLRREPVYTDPKEFLAHREARSYKDEEHSPAEFGIYVVPLPEYYETHKIQWDELPVSSVNLHDYEVTTPQELVGGTIVEHYLNSPETPSDYGYTALEGLAIKALYDEPNNRIIIIDGNHRASASLIANRNTLIRLAPFENYLPSWEREF